MLNGMKTTVLGVAVLLMVGVPAGVAAADVKVAQSEPCKIQLKSNARSYSPIKDAHGGLPMFVDRGESSRICVMGYEDHVEGYYTRYGRGWLPSDSWSARYKYFYRLSSGGWFIGDDVEKWSS